MTGLKCHESKRQDRNDETKTEKCGKNCIKTKLIL